jgi:hypothetical protein
MQNENEMCLYMDVCQDHEQDRKSMGIVSDERNEQGLIL